MELKVKPEHIKQVVLELGNTSDTYKEVTFIYNNGYLEDVIVETAEHIKACISQKDKEKATSMPHPVSFSNKVDKALDYLSQKNDDGDTKFAQINEMARNISLKYHQKNKNRCMRQIFAAKYEKAMAKAMEQLDNEKNENGDK